MSAERITDIYERRLIRRLMQTDIQTAAVYRRLIDEAAPIMARYRMTARGVIYRNPDLDRELTAVLGAFRRRLQELIDNSAAWAWAAADEKNDRIISEYISGMPLSNVARNGLFARNTQAWETFQKRKYDGMQISDRVWNLTTANRVLIEDYLDNGLITGRPAEAIARDVRQLLNEPDKQFRRVRNAKTGKLELSRAAREYHPGRGIYRNSIQNARRLARTEVNMAYRTSDQERWKSMDFILGYEVKLSAQHWEKMPSGDICDQVAGKYPKDFKFVGWHPNCMCICVPVMPSKREFLDRLTDGTPIEGEVTDVPEGLKGWVADNRDRVAGYNRQPFWVQDNFKGGTIDGEIKTFRRLVPTENPYQ